MSVVCLRRETGRTSSSDDFGGRMRMRTIRSNSYLLTISASEGFASNPFHHGLCPWAPRFHPPVIGAPHHFQKSSADGRRMSALSRHSSTLNEWTVRLCSDVDLLANLLSRSRIVLSGTAIRRPGRQYAGHVHVGQRNTVSTRPHEPLRAGNGGTVASLITTSPAQMGTGQVVHSIDVINVEMKIKKKR